MHFSRRTFILMSTIFSANFTRRDTTYSVFGNWFIAELSVDGSGSSLFIFSRR